MDRRQLLFGATALGLATHFNLNHLNAQVGKATMGNDRVLPFDQKRIDEGREWCVYEDGHMSVTTPMTPAETLDHVCWRLTKIANALPEDSITGEQIRIAIRFLQDLKEDLAKPDGA